MSDVKMSECCTCGTKWQAGQDGRHSCSSKLSKDNQALVEQNKALIAVIKDCSRYIECDVNNRLKPHNPQYLVDIANKALEQSK